MDKVYKVKGMDARWRIVGESTTPGIMILERLDHQPHQRHIIKMRMDAISEESPYTVGIKFDSGRTYHFKTTKGAVKLGDIIVRKDPPYQASVGVVVALDTRSKRATKALLASVLQTREIGGGDVCFVASMAQ